ncbi:TRAP transporter large permease [Chloroflexota bacterium]
MEPLMYGAIGLCVLFVLLLLGVPLAFAFAFTGISGLYFLTGGTQVLNILHTLMFGWSTKYFLMSIPLFVLMGEFAFQAGITGGIFNAVYKWIGRLKGGLAMCVVTSCGLFAACSGSTTATTAAIGAVAFPEMEKYKYPPKLTAGSIAAGGSVGIMIPPSISFIVYSLFAEESVGKLFMAGIFPGIMEVVGYALLILLMTYIIYPKMVTPGPSFSLKEKITSLRGIWAMVLLALIIIGGIYGGIFTPTEAGATGAFGALVISLVRRQLNWEKFKTALLEASKITGMIFLLIMGVQCFITLLALSGLSAWLSDVVVNLSISPFWILVFMTLLYIPLGCVLDPGGMHYLTYPIFIPILKSLGIDLIWFGVLAIRTTEIAVITPPLGFNVFVMKGVAPKIPLEDIFRGIVPFLVVDLICLALLLAFPEISLFLPGLMKPK